MLLHLHYLVCPHFGVASLVNQLVSPARRLDVEALEVFHDHFQVLAEGNFPLEHVVGGVDVQKSGALGQNEHPGLNRQPALLVQRRLLQDEFALRNKIKLIYSINYKCL